MQFWKEKQYLRVFKKRNFLIVFLAVFYLQHKDFCIQKLEKRPSEEGNFNKP
jgi:hypothetical protein